MITYEEINKKIQEHKNLFVLGICYILVFVLGFGVGEYSGSSKRNINKTENLLKNYTTNLKKNQQDKESQKVLGETLKNEKQEECIVKGNISVSGKKTYHIKGGMFYKRTKAEQCFASEEEAKQAGFVKSSR